MKHELKPCPFCGGKIISFSNGTINAPIVFLKCTNHACGAVVSFDNDKCNLMPEMAVDKWNRRTADDQVQP